MVWALALSYMLLVPLPASLPFSPTEPIQLLKNKLHLLAAKLPGCDCTIYVSAMQLDQISGGGGL